MEKYATKNSSFPEESIELEEQNIQVSDTQGNSKYLEGSELQEISAQIDKIDLQGPCDQVSNAHSEILPVKV